MKTKLEKLTDQMRRLIVSEELNFAFIDIDSKCNIVCEFEFDCGNSVKRRVKLSDAINDMIALQDGTVDLELEAKELDRLAVVLEKGAKKARLAAIQLRRPE